MIKISKVYKCFGWMHPNGNTIPFFVGSIVSFLMKVFSSQKYRIQHREFLDYKKRVNGSFNWNTYLGCHVIYGASLEDFYVYRFEKLNDLGRREYITDIGAYKYFQIFNDSMYLDTFRDKYKTYVFYKPYFKRDAIQINSDTTEEDVQSFINANKEFVIKPVALSCGKGIEKCNSNDYDGATLLKKMRATSKGNWIVEQLIVQSDYMNKVNATSVNTVRINAYKLGENIVIKRPFFRTGRGTSFVDNAGAGGIFMQVDPFSGLTVSLGYDEYGNHFIRHPDTGIELVDFQLPEWEELISITKRIMRENPNLGCCGWDFAHTNEGWVLVEGNDSHQFVCQQISCGHGCKKEMDELSKQSLLLKRVKSD